MSRRFFVPAAWIRQDQVTLSGREFHHLRHVLRLGVGAQVTLTDDLGREHCGVIAQLSSTAATLALTSTTEAAVSRFSLILAPGMLKGPKMDLVIEKATELGVKRIIPFHSAFTIATASRDRQAERVARWTRIAHSAAKQSGSHVPQIDPPQSFTALLALLVAETTTLLFYEQEKTLTLKKFARQQPSLSSLGIIVGSEGGFSAEEIAQARTAGVNVVGLGTPILRAETAGIVACAFCHFLWNG